MSRDTSPIRILAVDDHQLVREGIAGFVAVQSDMTVVAEAANGREAIQQFRTHRSDVTPMDLQMPEMNGLDALIAIRAEFHDARIIVLTTYEGDAHILRAVKAGAQGYLPEGRAKVGGPDRDRTGDLLNAIQARSQLRYRPSLVRSEPLIVTVAAPGVKVPAGAARRTQPACRHRPTPPDPRPRRPPRARRARAVPHGRRARGPHGASRRRPRARR
jgi:CheY-like chemotaxis protein